MILHHCMFGHLLKLCHWKKFFVVGERQLQSLKTSFGNNEYHLIDVKVYDKILNVLIKTNKKWSMERFSIIVVSQSIFALKMNVFVKNNTNVVSMKSLNI